MKKPIIAIFCSPGAPWYIGFIDKDGFSRFLPIRRKWFAGWKWISRLFPREWTVENCPRVRTFSPRDVMFYYDDPESDDDPTPEDVRRVFLSMFHSVPEFLRRVNEGEKIKPMTPSETQVRLIRLNQK